MKIWLASLFALVVVLSVGLPSGAAAHADASHALAAVSEAPAAAQASVDDCCHYEGGCVAKALLSPHVILPLGCAAPGPQPGFHLPISVTPTTDIPPPRV